jgi:hypothetical protein
VPWAGKRGVQRLVNGWAKVESRPEHEIASGRFWTRIQGSKLALARAQAAAQRNDPQTLQPNGQCTSGVTVSPQQWGYLSCEYRHARCMSSSSLRHVMEPTDEHRIQASCSCESAADWRLALVRVTSLAGCSSLSAGIRPVSLSIRFSRLPSSNSGSINPQPSPVCMLPPAPF